MLRRLPEFSLLWLPLLWMGLWLSINSSMPSWPSADMGSLYREARAVAPFLAAAFALILARRKNPFGATLRARGPLLFLCAYAATALFASLILSPEPGFALYWGGLYGCALIVLLSLLGLQTNQTRPRQAHALNRGIILGLAVLFSVLAIQRFDLLGLLFEHRLVRLYGSRPDLGNSLLVITSNGVGRFLALTILMACVRIFWSRSRAWIGWALFALAGSVVLFYTISRTAIVAFLAAVSVLVVLRFGLRRTLKVAALPLVVALLLGGPNILAYFERGQGLGGLTGVGNRAVIWEATIQAWLGSPLIGYGFQADRLLLEGEHVHNAWLQALIQGGAIGLAFFVLAWVLAWRYLVRKGLLNRYRSSSNGDRLFLAEATAFLVFFTVRSLTESTAAFYGVDLFLLGPLFVLLSSQPEPHAAKDGKRVLAIAYACTPPNSPGFGGGEDQLGWNAARQLGRHFDVWVATTSHSRQSLEAAAAAGDADVRFVLIDLPAAWGRQTRKWGFDQALAYLWLVRAYFTLDRLHASLSFDAVHHITYANDWMASHPQAILPARGVRGPGGGAHRVPKPFLTRYGGGFARRQRLRAVFQRVFRLDPVYLIGQARARAILVCNEEARRALPRRLQAKVEMFPVNGVAPEDFRPRRVSGNGFTIVTAGRLDARKGHDLVIAAFAKACRPDWRLRIAGDGPDRTTLEALATGLQVGSQVDFLGWQARDSVLDTMAAADVFAFGSLSDGGGAVVVEAMAQALPVVCLDLAGPGFHVDEKWGIKVPPTDPGAVIDAFAAAFTRLAEDPSYRASLGRQAKERAWAAYRWDSLGDRLAEIYRTRVFDERSGGAA